jgi:hypothetical protein
MCFERSPFDCFENAFFANKRIRARTTKFEISRTTGANVTLKMSNPEEMVAPRTRVTLFRAVHPFQSTNTFARYTWQCSEVDARRIANFTPKTNHPSPVIRCLTLLRLSRLLAGMHTSRMRNASFCTLPTIVSRVT